MLNRKAQHSLKAMIGYTLFYTMLAILIVTVVAFAVSSKPEEPAKDYSGEYKCGRYTLRLDKDEMVLLKNARTMIDTAYRVAEANGVTKLLPEQEWFVDVVLYDVSLEVRDDMVILETSRGTEKLYYPMVKGGK